jgi:ankyrin repeat protein
MTTPVLTALYAGRADEAHRLAQHTDLTLPEAAALGAIEVCRARLTAGDAVDTASPDGWTPLHLAAYFGRADVVALLLAGGASPAAVATSVQGNTALHAALAGALDEVVVRALLEAGAPVDTPDASQVRPVHLAAARGSIVALELLVTRGASVDTPLPDGTRAVDLAEQRGHPDAAEWIRHRTASMHRA